MTRTIRIGTRGSKLALWQANWVADKLRERCPGLTAKVRVVKTTGDRDQDRSVAEIGVLGAFTRELDRALADGDVDVAVHSLKDVPTCFGDGLALAAVPARADPRDAFVGKHACSLADLDCGAQVGTSSLRRRAQLLARRPDLRVADLRGNVDTRLRKLRESNTLCGILLAGAGVSRLGLDDVVTEILDVPDWLPAPGQGALAVMVRADDDGAWRIAGLLEDGPTRAAVTAERAVLARLESGCRVPVGAFARVTGRSLVLDGLIAAPDGAQMVRGHAHGACADAAAIGEKLADDLLSKGGSAILTALDERS